MKKNAEHTPSLPSWGETDLWKSLSTSNKPDASRVADVVKQWMPQIETVLRQGGTSPTDFTLHDDGHAFRVAQRMVEIMPSETLDGLTPYELAFLLLSAYLHDIGMTPEQRKVSLHYQYLVTGEQDDLSDQEVVEFQRWLDDDQDGIMPPLCEGAPTPKQLGRANRLVTHYCRHRHNDWSADWIQKNSPAVPGGGSAPLGGFNDWIDELIRLCRSHHFGWNELISDDFNPRLVGQPAQVLHMRYLACVLRVADVLEFDPERTPEVILRHRQPSPDSVIYWHKDHAVARRLDGERLVLSARPDSAYLYRAVEEMLDQIDDELALCRRLADETNFGFCPNLTNKQPHRWMLLGTAPRDLKPKPGTFVYINSAFRPNTEKILQLFSGLELYGDARAAVRELVQNAFDAVREQIAYRRLSQRNPSDRKWESSIGRQHRVELRLERRADGFWLICSDNGVGMNKRIIENHLLVSGQAHRHDIAALERRCRDAGFATGRTGRFGVGVLSYFMIADRLCLATRRSPDPKDADPQGWTFETQGIGTWGELREAGEPDVGTRFDLHIKDDLFESADEWYASLRKYLKETFVRVPCDFHLISPIAGSEPLLIDPGWARDQQDFGDDTVKGLADDTWHHDTPFPTKLLTQRKREQAVERQRRWDEVREKTRSVLRWEIDEGEMLDGVGSYRIHCPYFDLPGGPSLAFMDVDFQGKELLLRHIGEGFAFHPSFHVTASWKGMRVDFTESEAENNHPFSSRLRRMVRLCMYELDFADDRVGAIAINRGILTLTSFGVDCVQDVLDRGTAIVQEIGSRDTSSRYATLNARFHNDNVLAIRKPCWVIQRKVTPDAAAVWGPISFPAVDGRTWKYERLPESVDWNGKKVTVLPCLRGPTDDKHYDGTGWADDVVPPDRIVQRVDEYSPSAVPLWTRNPWRLSARSDSSICRCRFPPHWSAICGVAFEFYERSIWNRTNVLVRLLSDEAWTWACSTQTKTNDPLAFADEILADRTRTAAWILRMLELGAKNVWEGLLDRDAEFMGAVWKSAFPRPNDSGIGFLDNNPVRPNLRIVTPPGWSVYDCRDHRGRKEFEQYMPKPGPEWSLVVGKH